MVEEGPGKINKKQMFEGGQAEECLQQSERSAIESQFDATVRMPDKDISKCSNHGPATISQSNLPLRVAVRIKWERKNHVQHSELTGRRTT